jgi:hypothetical protein
MRNLALFATILGSAFCFGSASAADNGSTTGHAHHARAQEIRVSLTALSLYPRLTEADVSAAAKYRDAYDARIPRRMKTFQASSVTTLKK